MSSQNRRFLGRRKDDQPDQDLVERSRFGNGRGAYAAGAAPIENDGKWSEGQAERGSGNQRG